MGDSDSLDVRRFRPFRSVWRTGRTIATGLKHRVPREEGHAGRQLVPISGPRFARLGLGDRQDMKQARVNAIAQSAQLLMGTQVAVLGLVAFAKSAAKRRQLQLPPSVDDARTSGSEDPSSRARAPRLTRLANILRIGQLRSSISNNMQALREDPMKRNLRAWLGGGALTIAARLLYRRQLFRMQRHSKTKGSISSSEAATMFDRAQEVERSLDVFQAKALYEAAMRENPTNVDAVWRYGKQVSDMSLDPSCSQDDACDYVVKALDISRKAAEMDPGCIEAKLSVAINTGRLALYSDNKTKVQLCGSVRDMGMECLQQDPSHDMCHHVLGRWHSEMASINWAVKAIVRMVYGSSLGNGDFQTAVSSFQKALEIEPTRLIHRVELGRTYLRMGRREDARRELRAAFDMPLEDVNSLSTLGEAQDMLRGLGVRVDMPEVTPRYRK